MSDSIIVAQPEGQARQLMLLFHGVGSTPADLVPVGRVLAREFPNAFVVSVAAPRSTSSDAAAGGRQWFSVMGVDEENRAARVAAAMPAFVETVRHWQEKAGVDTEAIALVGFSQGGIMALESTRDAPAIAGRVISIAGRFAQLPESPNPGTTIHMFHGKVDPVIPYGFTVEAAKHLVAIGGDVTADVIPFVGHQITEEMLDLVIERLRTHLPKRTWEAAMSTAKALSTKDGKDDGRDGRGR